jgi:hypothetical protein
MTLSAHHRTMLVNERGIDEAIAAERPYCSLSARETAQRLPGLGFSAQVAKLGSGILFGLTLPDDPAPLSQFRPDHPRHNETGKPIKYEIPHHRKPRLILHPRAMAALRDGVTPLYITEGAPKTDSLLSHGATAVGGIGVWGFTVPRAAAEKKRRAPKVLLPEWDQIPLSGRAIFLAFDSDAALNDEVERAEQELAALLRAKGAHVRRVRLPAKPDGTKQGIDDFFGAGHRLTEVEALIEDLPRLRFDTISAVELFAKRFAPITWIIPGKLPAGCTLFVGRGKDGKSLMAWNLALAVVTGGKALGAYDVEPGAVLYLALEDGERRAQARLWDQMAHCGMSAPPPGLDLKCWDVPRIGEGFIERLETWLDEHPTARLVIVDILEKVRPARTKDGVYADDYRALEALQQCGQQRNVGVLVVHHSNKTKPEDFRSTASGSTGLEGACDTFWSLHRMAGAPDALLKMLGREIEQQELGLRFEDGFWTAPSEGAMGRMRPERQAILDVLGASAAPRTPAQICRALGKEGTAKEVNAVTSLLRKMLVDGQIIQPAYGVYALPSDSLNDQSDQSGQSDQSDQSDQSTVDHQHSDQHSDRTTGTLIAAFENDQSSQPLIIQQVTAKKCHSDRSDHPLHTLTFAPLDFPVTPASSNGYTEKEATTETVTPAKSRGGAHGNGTAPQSRGPRLAAADTAHRAGVRAEALRARRPAAASLAAHGRGLSAGAYLRRGRGRRGPAGYGDP